MGGTLPVGKLPVELLDKLLSNLKLQDGRVLLGPGIGLDCAVIDLGKDLLVLKSDPITFASDAIGWYAVQVNANDIATCGATPKWILTTLLLPERQTTPELVLEINQQLQKACQAIGVDIVGGHTEVTYGLDRPILVCTLIGEVSRQDLITPRGAKPGDRLLLTKGVPIEATAILGREFPNRLTGNLEEKEHGYTIQGLSPAELEQAKNFLNDPGISILKEAYIARRSGQVNAMHDPTEGGLYSALWELSDACKYSLAVDLSIVPVPNLSQRICRILGLDPLGAIASGALLLAVPLIDANNICMAINAAGIHCVEIGEVLNRSESNAVWQRQGGNLLPCPRPERDEIAQLFEIERG